MERNADLGGLPVNDAIVDRFLGDTVKMDRDTVVPNLDAVI